MRRCLIVIAGLLLAFMTPVATSAQSDEPAVLEGAVTHRLVLDEALLKSLPAVTIDLSFETDKGKSSGRYRAFVFGRCSAMPVWSMIRERMRA